MPDKFELYNQMMQMWLWSELHGKKISSHILNCGYRDIAIYGMGAMGELLYYELTTGGLCVKYVIDMDERVLCGCPVYSPQADEYPSADAVIVTAEYYYQDIVSNISKKIDFDIISLQQLLCDVSGLGL